MKIFTPKQLKQATKIINNSNSRLDTLTSSEIKDLAVAWCYYSGKIEGNTYTYVETEALLKDNITSEKRYDDAKMLKNLYNCFVSEIRYILSGNIEVINENTILRIHSILTDQLVSQEEKGQYRNRPVRISSTDYIPPKTKSEILYNLNDILFNSESISNPLEKAVYLHCNIAKIQPFIDGNKRTSRMIEGIVMMNNNLIPNYSTKDADILNYRKTLVEFYETGNYESYSNYFLTKLEEKLSRQKINKVRL